MIVRHYRMVAISQDGRVIADVLKEGIFLNETHFVNLLAVWNCPWNENDDCLGYYYSPVRNISGLRCAEYVNHTGYLPHLAHEHAQTV